MADGPGRVLRLDLLVQSEEDLRALRSALLAARATELGEVRRRSGRLSYGYGSVRGCKNGSIPAGSGPSRPAAVDFTGP